MWNFLDFESHKSHQIRKFLSRNILSGESLISLFLYALHCTSRSKVDDEMICLQKYFLMQVTYVERKSTLKISLIFNLYAKQSQDFILSPKLQSKFWGFKTWFQISGFEAIFKLSLIFYQNSFSHFLISDLHVFNILKKKFNFIEA